METLSSNSPCDQGDGELNDQIIRRRSPIALRYLVPNILTILAICAGVSAIRLAIEQKFEQAILLIVIAVVLDGLDGRVARIMNGSSNFGAQMDSLADVINFGVAPALIVYTYTLQQMKQVGWVAVLVYCIACCLRLARFNIMLESSKVPSWQKEYFVGVPAPAGALLVMLPVYIGFLGVAPNYMWAVLFSGYTVIVAYLLVSRLPVWNGKMIGVRLRRDFVVPLLLFIVAYAGFMATYTWHTLTITAFAYIVFLPCSYFAFYKRNGKRAEP